MGKEELLQTLKHISDLYFQKKDYISAGQINRAMDVIEDCDVVKNNIVLPAVMRSLPLEVISLLKQVRFTFSNYESGTIGKTMSEDADGLLKQYVSNEA
jgi:hypothetical protein